MTKGSTVDGMLVRLNVGKVTASRIFFFSFIRNFGCYS